MISYYKFFIPQLTKLWAFAHVIAYGGDAFLETLTFYDEICAYEGGLKVFFFARKTAEVVMIAFSSSDLLPVRISIFQKKIPKTGISKDIYIYKVHRYKSLK